MSEVILSVTDHMFSTDTCMKRRSESQDTCTPRLIDRCLLVESRQWRIMGWDGYSHELPKIWAPKVQNRPVYPPTGPSIFHNYPWVICQKWFFLLQFELSDFDRIPVRKKVRYPVLRKLKSVICTAMHSNEFTTHGITRLV